MAKELSKNKKLSELPKLKICCKEEGEQWQRRVKRSSSNPLLYFNERKQEIMTIKEERPVEDSLLRLEQTYYVPHKAIGFDVSLDDLDI
jgi:hypothetical protein